MTSKPKNSTQKVLKELKLLKIQQNTLEHDTQNLLTNLKNKDFNYINIITDENKISTNKRKIENTKLTKKVTQISDEIKNVIDEIQTLKNQTNNQENGNFVNISENQVQKVKDNMENVSTALNKFKQYQADEYQRLLNEFNIYEKETSILKRKLTYETDRQTINNNKSNSKVGNRPVKINAKTDNLPLEVTEYQDYLILNGGLNGNWNDYDHNAFLQIYKRDKILQNPEIFLQKCLINIPGKTIENIKDHRIWYEKLLQLAENKKSAIEMWKKAKSFQKSDQFYSNNIELVGGEGVESEQEKLAKFKQELKKKRELEKRELQKQQLEKWKADKKNQEVIREKAEEELSKQQEKLRNERLKKRQEQIKNDVDLYKLEKLAFEDLKEAEIEAESARAKEKSIIANKKLQKFRMMDQNLIEKRKIRKEIEAEMVNVRAAHLEKIKSTVRPGTAGSSREIKRDFSRLTSLTKSAQNRVLAEKDSVNVVVGSRNMPSRAMPSWCKGVNMT